MRGKGIAYSTGFVVKGENSWPGFDLEVVRRDLAVIRDELHCTAVHLVGGDPDRLEQAAVLAAGLGLEVWFSPYPLELTAQEVLDLFADCAERAERVRASGAGVVFVAGVELSIMTRGFIPGETLAERVARLPAWMAEVPALLNSFFASAVPAVRAVFGGRVTYAGIPFEGVDWDLFDVVSLELIRSAEVADRYAEAIRSVVAQGKPVAITGFGTAAWRGSGAVAPRSMEIVEHTDGRPSGIRDGYVRDEGEQARYLAELLEVFEETGVDSAFVYMFALNDFTHRPDEPRRDLDMASPGIVKVYEDGSWERKEAFAAVAEHYGRTPTG
ncbi:hypothetical protein BBK82_05730 [Lentzea guizhouensis]|uniref:Abortive infection protein n=1 Tax=Lentzea guizhouensis TaxID=1586287 RepID=A0A1B2HD56_9PSEU|nr:hypothetical protein [Lentzea guizhouensis]ANZ35651.1 hypothetical protein BBK82_05730 [Lentzea guizhouensis]